MKDVFVLLHIERNYEDPDVTEVKGVFLTLESAQLHALKDASWRTDDGIEWVTWGNRKEPYRIVKTDLHNG